MNKFIVVIVVLILLCLGAVVFNQSEKKSEAKESNVEQSDTIVEQDPMNVVKEFYKAYTADVLSEKSSDESINKKYLTRGLIERLDRIVAATGADPIIRAQDFSETAMKSLEIRPLSDNWYMASYIWEEGKNAQRTNIPLRVAQIDGRYMIDYITPEWNGESYGDNLLFDDPNPQQIDASDPLKLVETFYAAYTMEYCSIPENLAFSLTELRESYLAPNALTQLGAAAEESSLDGWVGYDLLIDNFDFDRTWIPSLKYTKLDESTILVKYSRGDVNHTIEIKTVKGDDGYKIGEVGVK